ncbi:hypothetical protein PS723_05580 [Pseudomonas fluorescens]|uniref:Uncharacterized protein n=1 Tax=Pseudomonas fluorescens TaxID=294 RepID=A0A5E7FMA6_PSEFL|nr:hypothetical protein PS723_05580 [Pseudomonas fluorescens]
MSEAEKKGADGALFNAVVNLAAISAAEPVYLSH